jgi:hypothetical protein
VERAAGDVGFGVDLGDGLERREVVVGEALVRAARGQDGSAGVEGDGCDCSSVRAHCRNLVAVLEDLDVACRCSDNCTLSPPCRGRDCAACLECLHQLLL